MTTGAHGRGGGEGVRTRDHLANVRTTLAWVRTGLALMAIGYAVDKLAEIGRLRGGTTGLATYGRPIGLASVCGGLLLIAAGLPRFLLARARIESDRFEPRPGPDLVLIGLVTAGGLAVVALLIAGR